MTTVFTDRKLLRLASRGLVNPNLQSAWRKKIGHDPIAISYAEWTWFRRQACLVVGVLSFFIFAGVMLFTAIPPGTTGAGITRVQTALAVGPFVIALLLMILAARTVKSAPRYSYAQRLFYAQIV